MFTGLVEEIGTVRSTARRAAYLRLFVECTSILDDLREGDSVSINGACQTAVAVHKDGFAVDSLAETLKKTTFGRLSVGSRVNLERALRVGDRLGGHMVQGHVDGLGTVEEVRLAGANVYLAVGLSGELHRYCIAEGSIAIDGVSLTIAELSATGVRVNIIPETWRRTALREVKEGDAVNIEVDVLARYVERLLGAGGDTTTAAGGGSGGVASPPRGGRAGTNINRDLLEQWGYGG